MNVIIVFIKPTFTAPFLLHPVKHYLYTFANTATLLVNSFIYMAANFDHQATNSCVEINSNFKVMVPQILQNFRGHIRIVGARG